MATIVSKITRHIKLAARAREIIDYTAGTNLLPVEFIIDDWTIPEGATAAIYAKKASGRVLFNAAEVNRSLNSILVTPTLQMFAEGGMIATQLQIMSDGKMLNSYLITFNVEEKVVSDEAIESTDEFTAFAAILQNSQTLTENVISDYVNQHGITTGANASQAAQIEANRTNVAQASADIQVLTESVNEMIDTVGTLAETVNTLVDTVNRLAGLMETDDALLQTLKQDMDDFNEGIEAYDLEDVPNP